MFAFSYCKGYEISVISALQFPPSHPMRHCIDSVVLWLLKLAALASILITGAIVLSVLFEAMRFFNLIPLPEFLFSLKWSPQSGHDFGAIPLFWGTIFIMLIAMSVAVPVGLFAAIYLAEYANSTVRKVVKPALEVLAGIPTVVYGYFAISMVSPFFRCLGAALDIPVSAESALTAGVVMGIMIIPFISSLSDDILTAVPQSLRDASSGLGATKAETIAKVVLPAALPGIMGSVLLGVSRAIGETMIVVMAAGLAANITINPMESVTTVTAQIVALLTGDQEFDSAKTLAAFALGLTLFVVTLILNVVALVTVKKYQEKYD
ncbi:MAG: phosphate ABC transporter permease subunit PstC [Rickettsiales bacterium]|nr:phosphate ABC transporter permease subunit PstC [Rickettsiales bacterium]